MPHGTRNVLHTTRTKMEGKRNLYEEKFSRDKIPLLTQALKNFTPTFEPHVKSAKFCSMTIHHYSVM